MHAQWDRGTMPLEEIYFSWYGDEDSREDGRVFVLFNGSSLLFHCSSVL